MEIPKRGGGGGSDDLGKNIIFWASPQQERLKKQKTILRGNFSHVGRPPPAAPPPQYGNAHVKNIVFFLKKFFFEKIKHFQHLRIILACKNKLVKQTKTSGFGSDPPPPQYGKNSHVISFFSEDVPQGSFTPPKRMNFWKSSKRPLTPPPSSFSENYVADFLKSCTALNNQILPY